MADAVVVAAVRSPIARAFKGSLIDERADDVLLQTTRSLLSQVPELDGHDIDEVLLGCGLAAGEQGGNLARLLPIMLGLDDVPGTTLNKYCASSMQTTRMASQAIRSGDGEIYLSLGLEMLSRVAARNPDPEPPEQHPLFAARDPEPGPWMDPRERGLVPNAFLSMGETAENVADVYGVSRSEMDDYACRSQELAVASAANGFWKREIAPIELAAGGVLDHDESPRPGTTRDGLAALKPAFRPDGRVTAGNSCPLNDGAAGLIVMSDERARRLGLRPRARIVATAVSALSPEIMGLGTVEAARRAMRSAGLRPEEIDLVEINEAFAAQVIPTYRELGFPLDRVNTVGGAIAVGHPFGMSGARITTTLINALDWSGARYGLQTMCVAGGQGMAMLLERLER
jgi:acetyl-CoA C-acetyltransferase